MLKVVFMGTPDIAVSVLEAISDSHHSLTAVITREDKPRGRGKELKATPVKEYAIRHGIPVYQPARIKDKEAVDMLRSLDADIFVVAAYGQILSKEILEIPRLGCINVHASLLPKYRGAAPIQWAIIDGEKETGITIMQMDEGLDTGDMLLSERVPIEDDETAETLHDKLAVCASHIIVEALDMIEAGNVRCIKQDSSLSSYARILDRSLGHIDFRKSAKEIERLVRGLYPWPSTYSYINGKTIKIFKAAVTDMQSDGEPGTVSCVTGDEIYINTGDGRLAVRELQLEGKKRMSAHDFLLGYRINAGDRFE